MKAFIGYLSMSGNTEDMASILKKFLNLKDVKCIWIAWI